MNVCGVVAIFPAITMSNFIIATEVIRKRKMTLCCAWMKDLESYIYFARKLLIRWYVDREIDLRTIGLGRTDVNF